jgi:hypothetical protein
MGPVVVEIFRASIRQHFRHHHAVGAGGGAGPWTTGFLHDLWGDYTIAFAIRHRHEHAVGGCDLAGFARQIRAVAGRLHEAQAGAG